MDFRRHDFTGWVLALGLTAALYNPFIPPRLVRDSALFLEHLRWGGEVPAAKHDATEPAARGAAEAHFQIISLLPYPDSLRGPFLV
jgi:hypothetical protein